MKKLLILSGKGGTGKTTTAAAFIRFSKAKAIADCDVDAPNLHLVTAMQHAPKVSDFIGAKKASIDAATCTGCETCLAHCHFDAIRRIDGRCEIDEYACEGCGVCEYVCPTHAVSLQKDVAGRLELYEEETRFSTAELKMGRGNSGKLVAAVKQQLFEDTNEAEVAMIDGSPGIGCPVMASVSGMDMVLIVTEPTVSGLNDLERLVASIATLKIDIAVCVNKYDVNPAQAEAVQNYCEEEGLLFAGKIPYDKTVSAYVNEGKSIAERTCPASEALYEIYKKTMHSLMNEKGETL